MPDSFDLTVAQRMLFETALNSGFHTWNGLKVIELRPGFSRCTFIPRVETLTPWGTLPGSVINAAVEVPAFLALLMELADDELPVTNDIFLQHVRPLPNAEYELVARLLRKGKAMAWVDVTVATDGKPCTYARLTKTLTRI